MLVIRVEFFDHGMVSLDRCFTAVLVSFIFRSTVVPPSFDCRSTVVIRRTLTGVVVDVVGVGVVWLW